MLTTERKGISLKDFDMTHPLDEVRDETGRVLDGLDKHMQVLERRRLYLSRRVEEARRIGKNLSHDEHECDALEWALDQLYKD